MILLIMTSYNWSLRCNHIVTIKHNLNIIYPTDICLGAIVLYTIKKKLLLGTFSTIMLSIFIGIAVLIVSRIVKFSAIKTGTVSYNLSLKLKNFAAVISTNITNSGTFVYLYSWCIRILFKSIRRRRDPSMLECLIILCISWDTCINVLKNLVIFFLL